MSSSYSINGFADTGFVFALDGDEMRTHKGRSVVAITVDERIHYLKRFWFTPSQLFKRHVARGFHELRMIDWLNANGFAGPKVVRRGHSRFGPLIRRMFFLMEEVPGECALEAAWRHVDARTDDLIQQLADFAARLHDAHFVHTDFSERHILVSEHGDQFGFRLIDVERASVGHAPPMR
ncbi:MAG: lipopolysaccharide kinase InaA family protein, partial [Planctomycetota bacterium]